MKINISISPNVKTIEMPENLKVGLIVSEQLEKCHGTECSHDDYAGFAFGQSPFHVPPSLASALGRHADKGHYSAAEGIIELREAKFVESTAPRMIMGIEKLKKYVSELSG